jgi:hypothetical protein
MRDEMHNGWAIHFRKNIHMHSHLLKVTKSGAAYEVPCEDMPVSNGLIGIWPYELNLHPGELQGLLQALREWATSSGLKYRLYTSKNDYESNEG